MKNRFNQIAGWKEINNVDPSKRQEQRLQKMTSAKIDDLWFNMTVIFVLLAILGMLISNLDKLKTLF